MPPRPFLALVLAVACGHDPAPLMPVMPPPSDERVVLQASALIPGERARLRALDVPTGATVVFYASTAGPGQGPCTPRGPCLGILGPVRALGSAVAGPQGRAEVEVDVPALAVGDVVWLQAGVRWAARRATSGVLARTVGDADLDGRVGAEDCDDGDGTAYVGAVEACDGVDDDCDGAVDAGLRVPADHPTIQDAIDAARPEDHVCVAAGTYTETVDLGGKDLVLEGAGGSSGTVIDGGGAGPVVTATRGERATIRGFTITGGVAERGAGMLVEGARLQLEGMVITGNACPETAASCRGIGLYAEDADLEFTGGAITRNEARPSTLADSYGVGAYLTGSTLWMYLSTVSENFAGGPPGAYGAGVGLWLDATYATVADSAVSGNVLEAEGEGAGIYITTGQLSLARCAVDGNVIEAAGGTIRGAGLSVEEALILAEDTSFDRNTLRVDGGGDVRLEGGAIHAFVATVDLTRGSVAHNVVEASGATGSVEARGGGAAAHATLFAHDTAFDGNTIQVSGSLYGDVAGAAIWGHETDVQLTGGSVEGNAASVDTVELSVGHGALYVRDGWLGLLRTRVRRNTLDVHAVGFADAWGGGVTASSTPVVLQYAHVDGNTITASSDTLSASAMGGALSIYAGLLEVIGGGMHDNVAVASSPDLAMAWGGAVDAGDVTIEGATFRGNVADATGGPAGWAVASGGAISAHGAVTLRDVLVAANTASAFGSDDDDAWGGGVELGGDLDLVRVRIADNTLTGASCYGGGGFLTQDDGGALGLTNVVVVGNTAGDGSGVVAGGGGLFLGLIDDEATARLVQADVTGNTASAAEARGGGLYAELELPTHRVELSGVHVVANEVAGATAEGGAIHTDGGVVEAAWCGFHDNGADPWSGLPEPGSADGNQHVDPLYADRSAADPGAWDLRLGPGSPSIDAGDPGVLDVDASRADIGAWGGPDGAW